MRKLMGDNIWLRHVAVAVAYALGYALFKEISYSHWLVMAGFRLGVLLFVPYRYWPALLVGEAGALAYTGITCAPKYGWLWASVFMVPPMLFQMPVVRWFRERNLLFPAKNATSMNALLACALVVSFIGAAADSVSYLLMKLPAGMDADYIATAGRYFLGYYIGVLTIVPLLLLVREEVLTTPVHGMWARLSESRLAMESVSLLLPAVALLAWLASGAIGSDVGQAARIAMFLPVAWLSMRHGWRGAAIGGTVASVAIIWTLPTWRDTATLQAQVFIVFTISTMLLLGARIAALGQADKRERQGTRMALAMAQRNVYMGEMQLRQTSFMLEQLSHTIRAGHEQLLGRLRFLLPSADERVYHRQAVSTQQQVYRLADTLYPLNWGDRGLPAALREGAIPRALEDAGVGYWCEISGTGLSQLSPAVHLALYRIACESVATVCEGRNVGRIDIRLRGGVVSGRRWAMLCVDGNADRGRAQQVAWGTLLPMLGGTGMGLVAIKDRAAAFEGQARERWLTSGRRVTALLFEPEP